MITFDDGPAQAVGGLELSRAPIFLRVVIDPDGKIDALDQIDDTPRPGERVFVYERSSYGGSVHACGRGSGHRGCRTYVTASYRHRADVDGEGLRETERWRSWAHSQPPARPRAEEFDRSTGVKR